MERMLLLQNEWNISRKKFHRHHTNGEVIKIQDLYVSNYNFVGLSVSIQNNTKDAFAAK
jgi:hypothetical protein